MNKQQPDDPKPDSGSIQLGSCNALLKLGDNCDICGKGIMLPPGGVAYYEERAKSPNPPPPHGHEKLVCTRCGHWHISMGPGFSSGPQTIG
jgi:hypothetical protein